jgi:hypothetical protein
MYPPQKFMMATFGEVPRAAAGLLSHQLDRQFPHLSITPLVPAPSALPEPLASRTCTEGHDDGDFRRVVKSAAVICHTRTKGQRRVRVILVKSGEREDRLPI